MMKESNKSILVTVLTGSTMLSLAIGFTYLLFGSYNTGFFSFYKIVGDLGVKVENEDLVSIGPIFMFLVFMLCAFAYFCYRLSIKLFKDNKENKKWYMTLFFVVLIICAILINFLEQLVKKSVLNGDSIDLFQCFGLFILLHCTLFFLLFCCLKLKLYVPLVFTIGGIVLSLYYGLGGTMHGAGRYQAAIIEQYYISENFPEYILVCPINNNENYLFVQYDRNLSKFTGKCIIARSDDLGIMQNVALGNLDKNAIEHLWYGIE